MERVLVRHKKATAPLDEAARARLWGSPSPGGSSSGSERSAEEDSPELDYLVYDSFYDDEVEPDEDPAARRMRKTDCGGALRGRLGWSEREMLEGLVSQSRRDRVGSRITAEAESAWRSIGTDRGVEWGEGARGWKRQLMWRLREKGFDAGLCKCRCEKTARVPAVEHEYVDVVADGRYIVEADLTAEFEIARPTARYRELLGVLPAVFVGKPAALKDITKVMCAAAAESMKSREMHVPPWRRREYVQAKWFGPYRRTAVQEPKGGGVPAPAVAGSGAAAAVQSFHYCRVDCGRRKELKERKLAVGL